MKLIGHWMKSLEDLTLPHPCELVGEMSPEIRSAVSDYLSQGSRYRSYRGYEYCQFRCGVDCLIMGFRELTDGEWIWPEGLAHYVRVHGIALPEEFIAVATSGHSPSGLRVQPLKVADSELLAYWVDWSTSRRSPAYREKLAIALEAARAMEPVVIQREVDRREKEVGLGDERCMFAGCSERVLLGAKICSRHSFWNGGLFHLTRELYGLPEP